MTNAQTKTPAEVASNGEQAPATPISPRGKFANFQNHLDTVLVDREEECHLALAGLLAGHHCLFVGPPGCAKSLIAETVRCWLAGARSLTIHCCKDTTRNAAFGPTKLSALKLDQIERNLTGGAADVEVLVLEEVFKAGPAVLDMFLMLMNERVYREGIVAAQAPLRFLLGCSNEWSPEGCEAALQAFFDRFLLRKEVKPIRTEAGLKRLCALPTVGGVTPVTPELKEYLSLAELDQAHAEVGQVPFSAEGEEAFWKIRTELVAEGICPGDRRLKQSVTACQAAAYLDCSPVVQPTHLEILSHCLWVSPIEQPRKAAEIVARIANPLATKINALLLQTEDVCTKETVHTTICIKLEAIGKEIKKLDQKDRRVQRALEYVRSLYRSHANAAIGVMGETE